MKREWVDRAAKGKTDTMVVWAPMIDGDDEPTATESARLFDGTQVGRFWDPDQRVGTAFRRHVFPDAFAKVSAALPADHWLRSSLKELAERYEHGPEWDIYMGFGRGVRWRNSPPRPTHFVRHLGRVIEKDGKRLSLMWVDDYATVPVEGSLARRLSELADSMPR